MAGGEFPLGDLIIKSANDYATVQVVAMDGRALEQSEKLLVQIGTLSRMTGFQTRPVKIEREEETVDGLEITTTGRRRSAPASLKGIGSALSGLRPGAWIGSAGAPQ